MHDLAPDVVVEAVFNPHASNEEGPFTFVPQVASEELQSSDAVMQTIMRDLQQMPEDVKEDAGVKEIKHGWGLKGMRGRREKRAVSTPVA